MSSQARLDQFFPHGCKSQYLHSIIGKQKTEEIPRQKRPTYVSKKQLPALTTQPITQNLVAACITQHFHWESI